MKIKTNVVAMLLSVLTLTSCQQFQQAFTDTNPPSNSFTNEANPEIPYSFSNFSDVPIPEESNMVIEKTRIFGEKDNWVGTLYLNSPFKIGNIYDFYSSQMSKFDWKKLSAVRGEQTILTYIKEGRIATILIETTTLSGTNISFTISPIPADVKEMFNMKNNKKQKKFKKTEMKIKENLSFPTNEEINSNSGALNIGGDSKGIFSPKKEKSDKDVEDFYNF